MTNQIVRQPERGATNFATPGRAADGWRQNGRKSQHRNQGDRCGAKRCSRPRGPKSRPWRSQSVRSSCEAGNDRGAKGRRKVET